MVTEKKLKAMFWRAEFYGAVTEGGIASMYQGRINALLELGHHCSFVSSGRMLLPKDVNYYYIPHSKLLRNFPEVMNLPYNRKSIKQIKKIINIEKPDFILQHHHDFVYSGSIVRKETGIPFLLHCDGYQYWVKKYWGKLWLDKALKICEEIQWQVSDAIFVPSQGVKNQIVENGCDSDKVIVIPNSVDTNMFTPDIDDKPIRNSLNLNNRFVCGFIGSFGVWHGVEVIAKAIKIVAEKIPDVLFLFVGDGALRPKIEEIIKTDSVSQNAIITGFVGHHEVPGYLAACDILLIQSLRNPDIEFFGSPTKLFEYMGMGKPIIASNVGQQNEIFKNEVNGILCEQNSPEALAESIIKLYRNPDLASKIAINARKDAVEKHDWKHHVQKIIDTYNKLINYPTQTLPKGRA